MTDILAFMDKIINQKRAQSSVTLWNRQFVIINVITTLAFFAEYVLVTTVPLFALRFGGNEATAGVFMSIISLTALLVRPILFSFSSCSMTNLA